MVDLIFIFRVITSKICDCEVFANFFLFDFCNESNGIYVLGVVFFLPTNFDFELDAFDDIRKPNCALDKRTILCLYVPGFHRQIFICVPKLSGFFISFKSYCCPELSFKDISPVIFFGKFMGV